MKRQLQTLLIILTTALFFTACEKEETTESYKSISGILTLGENVSFEDLSEILVYLAKLPETVDPIDVNINNQEVIFTETTTVNSDGSFSFENLELGNYVIALSEDFLFDDDAFCIAVVDGLKQNLIERPVIRVPEINGADYKYPSGRSHPGKLKTRKIKVKAYFHYTLKDKGKIQSLNIIENSEILYSVNCKTDEYWSFTAELDKEINYVYKAVFENGDQIIILDPIKLLSVWNFSRSTFDSGGSKMWYFVGWSWGRTLYFQDYYHDIGNSKMYY